MDVLASDAIPDLFDLLIFHFTAQREDVDLRVGRDSNIKLFCLQESRVWRLGNSGHESYSHHSRKVFASRLA